MGLRRRGERAPQKRHPQKLHLHDVLPSLPRGKVAISEDGELAAFNTGLVNKRYDDIYACFEPSDKGIEWQFSGLHHRRGARSGKAAREQVPTPSP